MTQVVRAHANGLAVGRGTHPSKQNFCRAQLIIFAALFVLWLLFVFTFGAAMFHAAHSMSGATL